jgi:1,4-alpha-glucan branching enzyme
MDFVLTLHSHLPWVLHHGRWPHGSDWLCEAAVDTYLPLVAALDLLERQGTPAPLTLGVTPVLANQLAHPDFTTELDAFLAQRLEATTEAERAFASGETWLIPIARYWRARLTHLRRVWDRFDRDLVGALRGFAERDMLELMSSAATHGFLPLVRCPESIRLQLALGRREHVRLFGREPAGCWLPECAYRAGLETHLDAAGYDYFFTDAHMASAGQSLGLYGEWGVVDGLREPTAIPLDVVYPRSPYRAYGVGESGVATFVRDPKSSLRVWSRHQGYPGDGGYLEFHKIRWPGGLKLWRVTGTGVDLGGKEPYDPNVARARAYRHAADYAKVLVGLAGDTRPLGGEVIVAPFDTELFGHWWFEGVDFVGDLYRRLTRQAGVRAVTASGHLAVRRSTRPTLQLAEGSWGANGDFSMWMNPGTEWTWKRLWALEERFWNTARASLPVHPSTRQSVLGQATRELLLAQSSDWQFIISTGAAADYAERRFGGHCDALETLLAALEDGRPDALARGSARAEALHRLDDLFPDPLPAVVEALGGPV